MLWEGDDGVGVEVEVEVEVVMVVVRRIKRSNMAMVPCKGANFVGDIMVV